MDKGHARALANSILAHPIADSTRDQYRRAARRLGGRHWRDYVADLVANRGEVGRSTVWVPGPPGGDSWPWPSVRS